MNQISKKSLVLFLAAAASSVAAPRVRAGDLELLCQPLYAERDSRTLRPSYVKGTPPSFTYYLFDSRDLLHYRIELVNNSPEPIDLGELGWPGQLEPSLRRDDEVLPAAAVRRDLLRRTQLDTVYLLQGRQVEGKLDFRPSPGGWGLEPKQEHDDLRQERRTVDRLPLRLETYQRIGVEIALVAADGAPLAPGVYRINFRDPLTGKSCDREQVMVLRKPETELDRVDGHLARFRFYQEAGDVAAAGAELRRAVDENPSSLTAWIHLSSFSAHEAADFETALEAAEKVQALIRDRAETVTEDSPYMLTLSRDLANNIDKVRQKAAEARAARASKAAGGGS